MSSVVRRSNRPYDEVVVTVRNRTIVCHGWGGNVGTHSGVWENNNPLYYATPLLLLQLSLISIVSLFIDLCLQPLGQSTIVSQILVSPSLLILSLSHLHVLPCVRAHTHDTRSSQIK